MKIQNEQLQALQQQAEAKAKKPGIEGAFDALLSEELEAIDATVKTATGTPVPPASPLFGLTGISSSTAVPQIPEEASLTTVAQSIEGMLSGLDKYAAALSSPQGTDLRQAYGILQNMDSSLAALRESSPDLASRHQGMAAMVDEIAVIARAESVKMNRGDYL